MDGGDMTILGIGSSPLVTVAVRGISGRVDRSRPHRGGPGY